MGKRLTAVLLSAAAAGGAFLCALPLPKRVPRAEESYACIWEDGERSEESFASAYASLKGLSEEGIVLLREGRRGVVPAREELLTTEALLQTGDLSRMVGAPFSALSPLERAALFRAHRGEVFYAGESYRYTGGGIKSVETGAAERVRLLDGALPEGYLASTGARELFLCGGAEFTSSDLLGSKIETVGAEAPYSVGDGIVFLETVGGTRLVAGLPYATAIVVPDVDFTDEGALAPCKNLSALSLPVLRPSGDGSGEDGTVARLFAAKDEYLVPKTLTYLRIRGGTVSENAFYACDSLREIDLRGVTRIEEAALLSLPALRKVTASFRLTMAGFSAERNADGSMTYIREGGEQ